MKTISINKALIFLGILSIILWNMTSYLKPEISSYIILGHFMLWLILLIATPIAIIYHLIVNGFKKDKNLISIVTFVLIYTPVILYSSDIIELFKSPIITKAVLRDDLFHYHLQLRENGDSEIITNGFMAFHDTTRGQYKISGDTITFTKVPYDNDFIPQQLLIDKEQNAIFIDRDKNGDFVREKIWLNHFEIYN